MSNEEPNRIKICRFSISNNIKFSYMQNLFGKIPSNDCSRWNIVVVSDKNTVLSNRIDDLRIINEVFVPNYNYSEWMNGLWKASGKWQIKNRIRLKNEIHRFLLKIV